MIKNELNDIIENLAAINNSLHERIKNISYARINMKENLESLQSSLTETENYIKVLKQDLDDNSNLFFLGVATQENNKKLERQIELKNEIEKNICEIEESINNIEDRNDFMQEIVDLINNSMDKLKVILDDSENCDVDDNEEIEANSNKSEIKFDKKQNLLEKLLVCQKFSKIDHERCYIELSKIIEEIKEWEEN